MPTSSDLYDEEYFERGIETGKSCYSRYRWIPELTIPMVYHVIRHLGLRDGDRVLDYGCAKGYVVKALRLLGLEAYGCDVSRYALERADPDARPFCWLLNGRIIAPNLKYDWIISKDVLEHMNAEALGEFLSQSSDFSSRAFHIIPLGDKGAFRIPEYSRDSTHHIAEDETWWIAQFESHGWRIERFSWAIKGIKENWTIKYPKGNGFFVLEKVKIL